jgi:hypothetical protein
VSLRFEPIVSFYGGTLKNRSSYRFDYSNEFLLMVELSQLNGRGLSLGESCKCMLQRRHYDCQLTTIASEEACCKQ